MKRVLRVVVREPSPMPDGRGGTVIEVKEIRLIYRRGKEGSVPLAGARHILNDAINAANEGKVVELEVISDRSTQAMCEHLIGVGKFIQAIKFYRLRTGCGLREAKQTMDKLRNTGGKIIQYGNGKDEAGLRTGEDSGSQRQD